MDKIMSFQEKEMMLCLRLLRKDCKGEVGHKPGHEEGVYNTKSLGRENFVSKEREYEDIIKALHFWCGIIRGPHSSSFFQSPTKILINLYSRVWRGT